VDVASGPLSTAVPAVAPEPANTPASTGLAVATPEYSAIITCRLAGWLTLTVIVSVPLAFPDALQTCSPIPQFVLVARLVAGVKVFPSVSVTDVMVAVGTFVPTATRRRSDAATGDENPTEYVVTRALGVPEFV